MLSTKFDDISNKSLIYSANYRCAIITSVQQQLSIFKCIFTVHEISTHWNATHQLSVCRKRRSGHINRLSQSRPTRHLRKPFEASYQIRYVWLTQRSVQHLAAAPQPPREHRPTARSNIARWKTAVFSLRSNTRPACSTSTQKHT